MRLLRWFIYWLWLHPIIINDYRLRMEGKRPDEWHWADELAVNWGFFTDDWMLR